MLKGLGKILNKIFHKMQQFLYMEVFCKYRVMSVGSHDLLIFQPLSCN
jgi:hypothetical protein